MNKPHNISNYQKNITDLSKPCPVRMLTFRFKFTDLVMENLSVFSKVHQHDDRADFKDAWKLWIEQHKIMIDNETTRLVEAGFIGDVVDKMFKSARYYLRKKSSVTSTPNGRKCYSGIHTPILLTMDKQIHTQIDNHILDNNTEERISSISPAEAFQLFCDEHQTNIVDAMRMDLHNGDSTNISRDAVSTYMNRMRKTYKNRFYIIRVNHINAMTTIMDGC
jgi:hypothetical protein|tara:strand:- start:131 stop:793 length:663 start_codon:yes stop_codon:yes gene_type:complete